VWGAVTMRLLVALAAATVYLPVVYPMPPPPRCDRGDVWPCYVWRLTREAWQSSTPTRTPRARVTVLPTVVIPTPTPGDGLQKNAEKSSGLCRRPLPALIRVTVGGRAEASAAEVAPGLYYVAAHSLPARAPWRLAVDGQGIAGWMRDPARDLAQVATRDGAGPATRAMGAPAPGDTVAWQSHWRRGTAVYHGPGWALPVTIDGRLYYDWAREGTPGAEPVMVLCADGLPRVAPGDSGGEVVRQDGALAGVIVAAADEAADARDCAQRQAVLGVAVP